jgi:hypothetical protein
VTDLSRRSFAESLAAAALVPFIGVRRQAAWPVGWDTALPNAGIAPGALAEALTGVIRSQYGSRLSSKDLATIAGQIQTGLERIDQLRKVQLANGDEPDFVFAATKRGS